MTVVGEYVFRDSTLLTFAPNAINWKLGLISYEERSIFFFFFLPPRKSESITLNWTRKKRNPLKTMVELKLAIESVFAGEKKSREMAQQGS